MIKQSTRNIHRHDLEKEMKLQLGDWDTANDVLDFLYGTHNYGSYHDYVVKRRFNDDPERTFLNRLNLFWVYPLFILLAPLRFLAFGHVGVNEDSMFGRVLIKLIGELS